MIFYTLVLSKFKLLWQLVLTACPALFSIVALSFLRRLVCLQDLMIYNYKYGDNYKAGHQEIET